MTIHTPNPPIVKIGNEKWLNLAMVSEAAMEDGMLVVRIPDGGIRYIAGKERIEAIVKILDMLSEQMIRPLCVFEEGDI